MGFQPNVLSKYWKVRRQGGGTMRQRLFTVAASQTIYEGDILIQTTSADTVEQALALPGSDSTATTSGSGQKFLGIAMESITTTSAGVETATGKTQISVAVMDDSTDWLTRIWATTGATAEQQDTQELAVNYTLIRFRGVGAGVWWYMLGVVTTNGILNITEKSLESNPADDYGFVWCKPLATARYAV